MSKIEFTISITKSDVQESVRKMSAYLGLKGANGDLDFEHFFMTKEQTEVMDDWWREVDTFATDILSPYIVSVLSSSTAYSVKLGMPSNWNDNQSYLKDLVMSMFVNYLSSKWIRIVVDGAGQGTMESKYASDFNAALFNLRKCIYSRVRPVRVVEEDDDDDETDDSVDDTNESEEDEI